jgi:very-short-patch-repair endonuclease
MKPSRVWNKERCETRSKNPSWKENCSKAALKSYEHGKTSWCKGLTAEVDSRLAEAGKTFKEGLRSGKFKHPLLGTIRSEGSKRKTENTNLSRYGHKNTGWMATQNSTSQLEIDCAPTLTKFHFYHNRFLGPHQVDFIDYKSKRIVELFGDYWHCNPNKYAASYVHPHRKLTANEMWEYDANRIQRLESYGYRVYVIWESDIKKRGIEECLKDQGLLPDVPAPVTNIAVPPGPTTVDS